jgi:hypothetical protein
MFAIIFFVASLILSLLAPKPKTNRARASTFKDVDVPKIDQGVPVNIILGTVLVENPTFLWHGDFRSVIIREKHKTGLFSSTKVDVAQQIYLGFALALGISNYPTTASLKKIFVNKDKQIWSGSQIGNGSLFNVSAPNVLGGYKKGGGVVGNFRFYSGSPSQPDNTYLTTKSGFQVGYRNIMYLVGEQPLLLEAGFGGGNIVIPTISAEVQSLPNVLGAGTSPDGNDLSPMEILYNLLISPTGRVGIANSRIDSVSWGDAVSTLISEDIWLSCFVPTSDSFETVANKILEIIDGILYENFRTGKIEIKLIRNDYVPSSLPIIDDDQIVSLSDISIETWNNMKGRIQAQFKDRSDSYFEKTVVFQNDAIISMQNKIETYSTTFDLVYDKTIAAKLAARQIVNYQKPRFKGRLVVNRKSHSLLPGSVFKLTYAKYSISELICRVSKIDYGDDSSPNIYLEFAEDTFSDSSGFSLPNSGFIEEDFTPIDISNYDIFESPRWLLALRNNMTGSSYAVEGSYLVYNALAINATQSTFDTYYEADSIFLEDLENVVFASHARVHTAVPITGNYYGSSIILKDVSNITSFNTATPSEIREFGTNLIKINNEIFSYESFTDNLNGTYTLNNVWRALMDTAKEAHIVDSRVWFLDDLSNRFAENLSVGSSSMDVKLRPNTATQSLDLTSCTIRTIDLDARASRAYCPTSLTVDGVSHPLSVTAGSIPLTWERREKSKTLLHRAGDGDETPVSTTNYIAEWTVNGGSLNTQNLGTGTSASVVFATGVIDLKVYAELNSIKSLFFEHRTFTAI